MANGAAKIYINVVYIRKRDVVIWTEVGGKGRNKYCLSKIDSNTPTVNAAIAKSSLSFDKTYLGFFVNVEFYKTCLSYQNRVANK